MRILVALGLGILSVLLLGKPDHVSAAQQNPVMAVDILLVPDTTMVRHAQADNARLLAAYPGGFKLDAAHSPHITLIQRFVRTEDLDKVYSAVGKVMDGATASTLQLEGIDHSYTPGGAVGVASLVVRETPRLLRLQAEVIAAVEPFTATTGSVGAFTAQHDDAASDAALIGYVATFVPKQTGDNFKPHVSTGVAPTAYLEKMVAEPFAPFTFVPVAAAVYQLGPFGTAAKPLKTWKLAP